MRWAAWHFLPIGIGLALLVALLLVLGGFRVRSATSEFGDDKQVRRLFTFNPAKRRGYKGILLVLAVLTAFFAAAQPQYGKGKRLLPRTNLDVVLVLDFSKSMYAQDVRPSRIFRAKVEIERLVRLLRGARFGAVAFAGVPMQFPLTADGAAIAQFLRRLSPNDMPVGGTAIARALSAARDLLARDPKAIDHKRVIVLVTDGEDLEGSPVSVAQNIGKQGTTIHVVQIGGRTPERIPAIGPTGKVRGWQSTSDGRPLLTSLSADGEKQLEDIATSTPGGQVIRAAKGTTGIDKIARTLRHQMVHELGERVESVYADVYQYPLLLALLLLLLESFWPEAPRRVFARATPPSKQPRFTRREASANDASAKDASAKDAAKKKQKRARAKRKRARARKERASAKA